MAPCLQNCARDQSRIPARHLQYTVNCKSSRPPRGREDIRWRRANDTYRGEGKEAEAEEAEAAVAFFNIFNIFRLDLDLVLCFCASVGYNEMLQASGGSSGVP